MSRKRELSPGPTWAHRQRMRAHGEQLIDADDEAIAARAAELAVDERDLFGWVTEARRRRGALS